MAQNTRPHKGASIIATLHDYVVIDLETTGLDPRLDSIIEIAAIRVVGGEIVSQYQTLINPGIEISNFIASLTGITSDMLSGAPAIADALPEFIDYVGQSTVIGHNVNFDINFIYDNCISILDVPFVNNYLDTMRLSRRLYVDCAHHRLCDLVERCRVDGDIDHRALSDAIKTNACYTHMRDYARDNGIDLATICSKRNYLSAKDIRAATADTDPDNPVYNKYFVFTGKLDMPRRDAMQVVVDRGGFCSDAVNKATNYLVLGSTDYCAALRGGKSAKHRRAEQLKLAGQDIEIITEDVFLDMLK